MAGGPRQLLLVAALVAVLLLIVGLLVVRPMLGGTEAGQTAPPTGTAAAATTTTPQLINPSTSVTPSDAAAASGKDPFRPLVSTGTASAATESGVTASGGAGSVSSSTLAATGSTVGGAGAGTATTPGGGTSAERQVALVSITGGTAKVTVDGTAYTVSEGDVRLRLPGHRHQLRVRQLRVGHDLVHPLRGRGRPQVGPGSDDWSPMGTEVMGEPG